MGYLHRLGCLHQQGCRLLLVLRLQCAVWSMNFVVRLWTASCWVRWQASFDDKGAVIP